MGDAALMGNLVYVQVDTVRIFKDFEELKTAVGSEVSVSDWVEVTQERIDQFAKATGDEQWIHVDVERATRSCRARLRLLMAC